MKHKHQRTSHGCLFTTVILIVLTGAILYAGIQIPKTVSNKFGPPSRDLNIYQIYKYSIDLLLQEKDLTTPVQTNSAEAEFAISLGESVNSVASRLQEMGLIRSADAFTTYLIYTGLDKGIQSGNYQLNSGWTPVEVARKLQDSTPVNGTLVILPGWRMEEIAASLPTSGLSITPEDFLSAAQNPKGLDAIPTGLPRGASLEGYLFPDSYQVKRDATPDGLLNVILNKFDDQLTPALRKGFKKNNLTLHQAVILASIVQKESVHEDEQPEIASVFINRLALGMNLESDPTVQYAVGFDSDHNTWWKNPLTAKDLKIGSPYNTYQNPGLPPGPIANPGLSALTAVASPAQTDYLYFRSRCDQSGYHVFAQTYQQHLQNACE